MPFIISKIPPRSLLTLTSTTISRSLCAATEVSTQKLERIADELFDLTKLERYDYSILFHLKLGLNRYGPAVTGPSTSSGPSVAADVKAAEEKTAYDVKLEKFDAAVKIKIIKEVRAFTDLGLKEFKDFCGEGACCCQEGDC